MRQDTLHTRTELGYHLCHPLTGLIEGGTVNVGLCRDAAHVQTRAAYVVILEDDHLQTLMGSILCSTVATGSRPDDNEISMVH